MAIRLGSFWTEVYIAFLDRRVCVCVCLHMQRVEDGGLVALHFIFILPLCCD